MGTRWAALPILVAWASFGFSQTTQGLISGRIIDSENGQPLPAAMVICVSESTTSRFVATTGGNGDFVLPLLSPGLYSLRVEAAKYQPQQLQQVELAVAGRLHFQFRLRPLVDVWEAGQYRSVLLPDNETIVTFYGPDVDTSRTGNFAATHGRKSELETSLSTVIDTRILRNLPLGGRDTYTLLAAQPGVTADSTTGRALGLAVNGQRPSASNFLLDGLENNNYLLSGPLFTVAPEAVQEYRISTANYSAEYGRTSGYLANVVTQSGSSRWHGLGYFYLKNEKLNANEFQRNLRGLAKAPLREQQAGTQFGGPLLADRLFVSGALEYSRFRGRGLPFSYLIPGPRLLARLPADSATGALLRRFTPPAPQIGSPDADLGFRTEEAPSSVNRLLSLPRLDWVRRNGAERFLFRGTVSLLERPDFLWSPYPDLTMPLKQSAIGAAVSWTRIMTPSVTSEMRFSWSQDELLLDQKRFAIAGRSVSIPVLNSGYSLADRPCSTCNGALMLPSAPSVFGYRNAGRNLELVANLLYSSGRHVVKFGGGYLRRDLDGFLTAGRDGSFSFSTLDAFLNDRPSNVSFALARQSDGEPGTLAQPASLAQPEYDRSYRYQHLFGFAQDSIRLSSRFTVNLGLRYEYFGVPVNNGRAKDFLLDYGAQRPLAQALPDAELIQGGSGDQPLYLSDRNNFAGRFAFAWAVDADQTTTVRGGTGIFYDRPFDNLWQTVRNNNQATRTGRFLPGAPVDYLSLLPEIASHASSFTALEDESSEMAEISVLGPAIRNPYVQESFLGISRRWSESFTTEGNVLGAFARRLFTTDLVNREFSMPSNGSIDINNIARRLLPGFGNIGFRGNQGFSRYYGVNLRGTWRSRRVSLQASYTWGRFLDNQSEILSGEFFDFRNTSGGLPTGVVRSTFTRQFDSAGDYANSDFDQRHNLVTFAVLDLPGPRRSLAKRLFSGWTLSPLLAVRSGFPVTVLAGTEDPFFIPDNYPARIYNNRPNLVLPDQVSISRPVPGGEVMLNPAAFAQPEAGTVGSSGRNALRGPGVYSFDLGLGRTFPVKLRSRVFRFQARVDAFNVLNHTNLNQPYSFYDASTAAPGCAGASCLGRSSYGRVGRGTGFPLQAPFQETGRQLQVLLRSEF